MHTIPYLYTHPASREDATLPIYVGAYFLSNSLHLNARKYITFQTRVLPTCIDVPICINNQVNDESFNLWHTYYLVLYEFSVT